MEALRAHYAETLLAISEKQDTMAKDLEQAILLRDTLKHPDVQSFLVQQHIPDADKIQLFQQALPRQLAQHLQDFLYQMVRNNHESLIVPVLAEYIERIDKRFGIIEAQVVSAKALTDEQIESIRRILAQKSNKQVEVKASVDPDVIGGFYVLVDGHIFDGTVRTHLNNMKARLKRGIMNDS
ncbi:MAG: ATP synthase F1 subunit delta [Dethiobacteraceae bacterium]|jgi:F-type H+-transporting ATPase subunit delta|nr:ATP synthase F1 subunit delta [Bacillota bacterium]